jgi:hypothetical protein
MGQEATRMHLDDYIRQKMSEGAEIADLMSLTLAAS